MHDFSTFPPIFVTSFISSPGYTPFMQPNTPHPTSFSMSSMHPSGLGFLMPSIQPSEPSFPMPFVKPSGPRFPMHSMHPSMQYLEPSGSSMPHSSPMHYAHDEQDDEYDHGDTSAHDYGDTNYHDNSYERKKAGVLRNTLQTIKKHLGRFIIKPEGVL